MTDAELSAMEHRSKREMAKVFPNCGDKDRQKLLAEVRRLRAENERVRLQLSEAALEINCAGTVAHRIRIFRDTMSRLLDEIEQDRDALRARLALYEPQERDETLVCQECGCEKCDVECSARSVSMSWGHPVTKTQRWRMQLAERIKRGEAP